MSGYTPIDLGLNDAIRKIANGSLQLPDFQRDFVWRRAEQKALIDSLQKGYPVGALLFLKVKTGGESPFGAVTFNSVELPKTVDEGLAPLEYLVLDGQQRLTSSFQAFSKDCRSSNVYCVNLRSLHQAVIDKKQIDLSEFIESKKRPLLLDSLLEKDLMALPLISEGRADFRTKMRQYAIKLAEKPENETFAEFLQIEFQTLMDAFFDYKFPCVVLPENLDLDAVANVFTKLNSSGVSLSAFDLCVSRLYPRGVRLRELWNTVKDNSGVAIMDTDGTGILQTIHLISGKPVKKSTLVKNIVKSDIDAYWALATQGFAALEEHLNKIGIYSRKTLPYDAVGPSLVAALHSLPKASNPAENQTRQMRITQFILQTAFSLRYTEGSDAKKEVDYPALKIWLGGGAKPEFLTPVQWSETLSTAKNSGARYNAFLALLNHKKPKDLIEVGKVLGLDNGETQAEIHHIFPRAWIKNQGLDPKIADRAFNMTFLSPKSNKHISDKSPSKYLKEKIELDKELVSEDVAWQNLRLMMAEHFIDSSCLEALLADDYEAFLVARANVLKEKLILLGVDVSTITNDVTEDDPEELEE